VNSSDEESYDVRIIPEALRYLDRLPARVRSAALAAVRGQIREQPYRLGERLVAELAGLLLARRGDYRIIYSIDDSAKIVIVHRIQHRGSGYRRR
jgi:mRNA-degrading endonuclease RelE of RelBE toxin-antitoxin system